MCTHLNRLNEAILISTLNIPFFNIKRNSSYIIPNLPLWDLFQGTQERVQTSHGKRAISVRATEVLLYFEKKNHALTQYQERSHFHDHIPASTSF